MPRQAAILLGMHGDELKYAATDVIKWHGKLQALLETLRLQHAAKRAPDETSCKVEATSCKFAKAEVGEEPSQPSPQSWQQPSPQPQPSQPYAVALHRSSSPAVLPAQPAWIPASLHARALVSVAEREVRRRELPRELLRTLAGCTSLAQLPRYLATGCPEQLGFPRRQAPSNLIEKR